MKREGGFTLIELLVVMSILSVLAALSSTSFFYVKGEASYATATSTVRDARTAIEYSLSDADNPPPAVPLTVQTDAGPVVPAASDFLPGITIPRNVRFSVFYDPGCQFGGCASSSVVVGACLADKSVNWTRFGDGSYLMVDDVAGAGC